MQQLKALLASLTSGQKIGIALALILTGAGLTWLVRYREEAGFRPLYEKLSAEDAGQLVQKLKESGVPFRISNGGTSVSVPSQQVAELRLEMASAGLPRTGRIGFELFDRSNFGTTDFGEQVNFRRAIEGELERSIMSLAEVESARVHVTFPKNSVFLESREQAKASVLLQLRTGMALTPQNVLAVSHLVSNAVEGLKPEMVSILDSRGNLLSKQRRGVLEDGSEPSEASLEYRKKLENEFVQKISSTLDPLLGPEGFRAGVSVECDFTSGEQSEETFDPDKSVMTTSTKSEDTQQSATPASGVPGTASNLPRPAARSGNGPVTISRRSENITYQTSRVTRRMKLPQGAIRKISASVLLDQTVSWERQGSELRKVITPPTAEKLKTIRELVAAVIGFDEERGDQLTVDSLPFDSTLKLEPPRKPAPPVPAKPDPLQEFLALPAVRYGVPAGAALLVLAGFLLLRRNRKRPIRPASAIALPAGEVSKALAGPDDEKPVSGLPAHQPQALLPPSDPGPALEDLTTVIRKKVDDNAGPYVQVLRVWLTEDPKS